MTASRTRSVAVLGNGIAGTAAAAAFRRALPDAEVTLFAAGAGEPEYLGAAAPSIHAFHGLIGIQPELFRRRTGAIMAREAEIRHAGRPAFTMVPLSEMPHTGGAALHQLWLRRTAADPAAGLAWEEVARRARRRDDLAEGLGVRFDARAYLELLRELAAHLGVKIADAGASRAQLAASYDVVIDTLGEEGDWLRIDGVPGDLQWQLRPDSAGASEGAETIELTPTNVSWESGPWRADGRIGHDVAAAGYARAPWDGNVISVGRAAVQCETFDGQPLAVALAGIARALELLPRPGAAGREAEEYNRRTNTVHGFLLDWAAERWGVESPRSPGLTALRAQFEQRGRIPFRDEDPVPAAQWIGWLLASGERPRHIDLTAMAVPEEQLAALFAQF